eukprot:scaffold2827_cov409-Prasinococcus_capsulatus_cf.AAC.7
MYKRSSSKAAAASVPIQRDVVFKLMRPGEGEGVRVRRRAARRAGCQVLGQGEKGCNLRYTRVRGRAQQILVSLLGVDGGAGTRFFLRLLPFRWAGPALTQSTEGHDRSTGLSWLNWTWYRSVDDCRVDPDQHLLLGESGAPSRRA